jgi:hypothetical protein
MNRGTISWDHLLKLCVVVMQSALGCRPRSSNLLLIINTYMTSDSAQELTEPPQCCIANMYPFSGPQTFPVTIQIRAMFDKDNYVKW